jgi:hypothetical protein
MGHKNCLAALVVFGFLSVSASAQLVVTPSNSQGWVFTATTDTNLATSPAAAAFLALGFETPPLGDGSVHLSPGADGNDSAQARHPGYAGTPLSNLTALSYSTFVEVDGSGGQAPYLILQVDTDGDAGIEDLLFFEPAYQSAAFFPSNPQGPLTTDTWQTWNALAGGWYSVFGTAGSGPGTNVVSFATLAAALPTGVLANSSPSGLGAVRIVTGFGAGAWDNFLGAADNFTIGVSGSNTTYDFEEGTASVVTVTPSVPDGWTYQVVDDDSDTVTTGSTSIVTGPGTPPMGDGSLQFNVGAEGEDGVQARQSGYDGQFLRDLAALEYSTYIQTPGSGGQAPYLILDVDLNNDGTRDDLWFFEPVYQDAVFCPENPQPALVTGAWQTWEATNGCWYSLFGTAGTGPGANAAPLATLLDAEPDARLSTNISGGSFRVVTGFGAGAWTNFVGNADAVNIGFQSTSTTFDFEPVPTIIIGDVTLAEGNIGTTAFTFTLTLSEAVSQTVTVDYTTADNTATAADSDYAPVLVAGTATFAPNTTSTTITIQVTGDTKFENNETFFVNLTNPQNASIVDAQATGTIQNDDAQPSIAFTDLVQAEGTGTTTNFVLNVTLSNASAFPITVNYTTNPGSATEGTDYSDATGTLTFVPGDTTESITIVVTADSTFEPDETLFVDFSGPTNATLPDNQALVTITNDDTEPTILIADVSQAEGTGGTTTFLFNVTLSNPSASTVTVNYTTNPVTATEGTDYTDATGTLTFVPGDTSETISVSIDPDAGFEPNETFTVDLSGPTNATLADTQATGTINNDDGAIADVSITKTGPSLVLPSQPFDYTITVSNAGPQTASNVVVTDNLTGVTFVSATPSQGSCVGTTNLVCTLGAIANGGTATITLTVMAPASGTITNTASVTNAPETDPTPANNAATTEPATVGLSHVPTLSEWALLALLSALATAAALRLR